MQFADGKDYFDFPDFKAQMTMNPDLLAWFSKPEEAMNKRLNRRIDKTLLTKKQMLTKVHQLKNVSFKYFDDLGLKLSRLTGIFDER
jgi:hypothetical protein